MRFIAFILAVGLWIIPVVVALSVAATYPLVLDNSPVRLLAIAALIASPVLVSVVRFGPRRTAYLTAVMAAQVVALGYINRWF